MQNDVRSLFWCSGSIAVSPNFSFYKVWHVYSQDLTFKFSFFFFNPKTLPPHLRLHDSPVSTACTTQSVVFASILAVIHCSIHSSLWLLVALGETDVRSSFALARPTAFCHRRLARCYDNCCHAKIWRQDSVSSRRPARTWLASSYSRRGRPRPPVWYSSFEWEHEKWFSPHDGHWCEFPSVEKMDSEVSTPITERSNELSANIDLSTPRGKTGRYMYDDDNTRSPLGQRKRKELKSKRRLFVFGISRHFQVLCVSWERSMLKFSPDGVRTHKRSRLVQSAIAGHVRIRSASTDVGVCFVFRACSVHGPLRPVLASHDT